MRSSLKDVQRHGLTLLKDDDTAGDIVQLAAARRAMREEALKKLHIARDDNPSLRFKLIVKSQQSEAPRLSRGRTQASCLWPALT